MNIFAELSQLLIKLSLVAMTLIVLSALWKKVGAWLEKNNIKKDGLLTLAGLVSTPILSFYVILKFSKWDNFGPFHLASIAFIIICVLSGFIFSLNNLKRSENLKTFIKYRASKHKTGKASNSMQKRNILIIDSQKEIADELNTLYRGDYYDVIRNFVYNHFECKNQLKRLRKIKATHDKIPIYDKYIFVEFFWVLQQSNKINASFQEVACFLSFHFPSLGKKEWISQIPIKHNFKSNYKGSPNLRVFYATNLNTFIKVE